MAKVKPANKTIFPIWIWAILVVMVISAGVFFYIRNSTNGVATLAKEITPAQATELQKKGAFMLDI